MDPCSGGRVPGSPWRPPSAFPEGKDQAPGPNHATQPPTSEVLPHAGPPGSPTSGTPRGRGVRPRKGPQPRDPQQRQKPRWEHKPQGTSKAHKSTPRKRAGRCSPRSRSGCAPPAIPAAVPPERPNQTGLPAQRETPTRSAQRHQTHTRTAHTRQTRSAHCPLKAIAPRRLPSLARAGAAQPATPGVLKRTTRHAARLRKFPGGSPRSSTHSHDFCAPGTCVPHTPSAAHGGEAGAKCKAQVSEPRPENSAQTGRARWPPSPKGAWDPKKTPGAALQSVPRWTRRPPRRPHFPRKPSPQMLLRRP